jgi:parallel beta helix pectate lyase-like protein
MHSRWYLALAAVCAAGPASCLYSETGKGAAEPAAPRLAENRPVLPPGVAVPGKTYTVATTGSDSNNGISAPFRTLRKGVAALRSGDTLVIKAGTYPAGINLRGMTNITIRGEGEVVLDGAGVDVDFGLFFREVVALTLDNLRFRNCRMEGVYGEKGRFLTVKNCEFSNNGITGLLTVWTSDILVENVISFGNQEQHGIYLSRSGDRYTVRNCRLYGNGWAGLQINAVSPDVPMDSPEPQWYDTPNLSTDCVVEGNTIYDNGRRGAGALSLMGVRQSLIRNNLIHSNRKGGIVLADNGQGPGYASKDNRFYHNTVVFQPGAGKYGITVKKGSTGNQFMNNILTCGGGAVIYAEEPVQSNYNCLYGPTIANDAGLFAWRQATGNDLHSIEGDPALTADFRPSPASPARKRGLRIPGVEQDKDGRSRMKSDKPDLGCYQAD